MSELKPSKKVIIHTDGGCEGNPGPGGWAAVLRYGDHSREVAGAEPATTNNRMELQAAIAALAALKQPCEVTLYTDSQYLRQGITEWLRNWKRNGWRTTDRKPVKNDDLWRQLDELARLHRIEWKWLKGHVGHPDNERCDVLATAAILQLRKELSSAHIHAARNTFIANRGSSPQQPGLL